MSVEWLKKQKQIQKRTEPKEQKKKKSGLTKIPASDYLKKTPSANEKKLKTLEMIQSQLTKNQKSKVEKEQREEELLNEIEEVAKSETAKYDELIDLAKQKAQTELETAQFQKEQARLTLENEKLVNIQYKQNFENYVKHMKELGIEVKKNEEKND